MAIFLSAISHPILDMFFHDAYVLAGNRAVSRVTVNFWQIYYMEPVLWTKSVLGDHRKNHGNWKLEEQHGMLYLLEMEICVALLNYRTVYHICLNTYR